MALFVSESPVLGPGTQIQELSGYAGAPVGAPALNAYKPTTRETVQLVMPTATSHATGWIWQAPWKCQVVAVRENHTTASSSGTLDVVKIVSDTVAPGAANGTTILTMLASTISTAATANTRQQVALTTTTANLILNAGDQLATVTGGSATNYVGGLLQIEVVQIG